MADWLCDTLPPRRREKTGAGLLRPGFLYQDIPLVAMAEPGRFSLAIGVAEETEVEVKVKVQVQVNRW